MIFRKLDRYWSKATSPMSWRKATRQRFILTLPLSLPLWLGVLAALIALFTLRAFFEPIRAFWCAPPRRRRNGYYHHRSGNSAGNILLELAPSREAA